MVITLEEAKESTIPVPNGKSYLPYQIEGIEFALKHKGTLIADEMGLGKTIQAIGVINALYVNHNSSEPLRVLVVCPASLKLNWWNEIDGSALNVLFRESIGWLIWKNGPGIAISVISYEQLSEIPTTDIDLFIIDEIHLLKNPKSIRSIQAKRIAKKSRKTIGLSGTPIKNRPLELWPIVQILCPERWDPKGRIKVKGKYTQVGPGEGANFFTFARRYCGAVKKQVGKKSFWDFQGASNLEELNQNLRETCMIRRLKSEVLSQLPPKRHQVIVLPNTNPNESHATANSYFEHITEENYEETISRLHANKIAFAEYSKVRHEQGIDNVEPVLEHVINTLDSCDKIILFAHHTDVILKYAAILNFYGCVFMTGETPLAERQHAVDIFMQDPNCKVIIGSIGTMGVGWTLTESSLVMFAEVDPVPGNMLQAADRAHRIGQEKSVNVQYLVRDGSIDARICKILVKKMKVVGAALDAKVSVSV